MAIPRKCLNHKDGLLYLEAVIPYYRYSDKNLLSAPLASKEIKACSRATPPPNEIHFAKVEQTAPEFPELNSAKSVAIQPQRR